MSTILKTFLRSSIPLKGDVCLIFGNEAADADSIVSSLCMAYLSHTLQSTSSPILPNAQRDLSFVPVVSIPRKVLQLRRETQLLLNKIDLDLDDLVTIEDIDIKALSGTGKIKAMILVDHNELSPGLVNQFGGKDEEVKALVKKILDHHSDNKAYPEVIGVHREIAFDEFTRKPTAGSTCTLVAELLFQCGTDLLGAEEMAQLSTMLMGVICIDTMNLDARGQGTLRDQAALEKLEKKTIPNIDRQALYVQLRDSKSDPTFWASLSAEQCLNIDYKQFLSSDKLFGMASMLCPVQEFVKSEACAASIQTVMNSTAPELDLIAVMTFVSQPELKRELFLVSKNKDSIDALDTYFVDTNLGLSPLSLEIGGFDGLFFKAYTQANLQASRKAVAPLLQAFYTRK